jgi:hypothetical protein
MSWLTRVAWTQTKCNDSRSSCATYTLIGRELWLFLRPANMLAHKLALLSGTALVVTVRLTIHWRTSFISCEMEDGVAENEEKTVGCSFGFFAIDFVFFV